jgi:hypothetical protein
MHRKEVLMHKKDLLMRRKDLLMHKKDLFMRRKELLIHRPDLLRPIRMPLWCSRSCGPGRPSPPGAGGDTVGLFRPSGAGD